MPTLPDAPQASPSAPASVSAGGARGRLVLAAAATAVAVAIGTIGVGHARLPRLAYKGPAPKPVAAPQTPPAFTPYVDVPATIADFALVSKQDCQVDRLFDELDWSATGAVANESYGTRSYVIRVDFLLNGRVVASDTASVGPVLAQDTGSFYASATSPGHDAAFKYRCRATITYPRDVLNRPHGTGGGASVA